jgi:hypothetical protein
MTTFNTDFVVKNGILVRSTATIQGTSQATSTQTGALIVSGGVGVAKDLHVGGSIYSQGALIVTSATIGNYQNAVAIAAGTDTVVSTITGVTYIWNISTLQSVTSRGPTTSNALQITNTTTSITTQSGALVVNGGVGIGTSVYVGNRVGWVGGAGASAVFQVYNTATNSLDTIFG